MLLHGQTGIGKVDFARHYAQSLLCDKPDAQGHACGVCQACQWFAQRSHPDFRMVRPEAIEMAEGMESEGGEDGKEGNGSGEGDESSGATESSGRKSKRAPSREIRIEQVRALADFMNIGTHRGGLRIVLLYPAQAMNAFTANALLKMLEEPPAHSLFLLVADGLERILPTILSRCRKFPMPVPAPGEALAWLRAQDFEQPERWLAEQGGAPLAALRAAAASNESDAVRDRLLRQLAEPAQLDALDLAEPLSKCALPVVAGWLQRWLFDCLSYRLTQRIRYYPEHAAAIAQLAKSAPLAGMLTYARQLEGERRVAEHPLNARLFCENLLLAYAAAFGRRP